MLLLSCCITIIVLWLLTIHRQLLAKKRMVLSALTSIDKSLKLQTHTTLKVVHYADVSAVQKESYFKSLNDYRHAFQSDVYKQHQYKNFGDIQRHLHRSNELSNKMAHIISQLDDCSQPIYIQSYFTVHSEFSTLCRQYNQAVEQYNLKVKVFPSSCVSHFFQFTSLPFFDIKPINLSNEWMNKASSYQF